MTGDGLVRPINAPPPGTLSPGVQPGTSSPVITASRVIVIGNKGGVFVYSAAPALGNLIASVAPVGGTDPYGNAYLAGFYTAGGGGPSGQLLANFLNFSNGTSVAGAAIGALVLGGTPGTNWISTPLPFNQPVTASVPGTPQTAETWHAITLDAGWTATVTPEYRLLADGNVQVRGQASHAATTVAVNINSLAPVPVAYQPAANRVYRPPDAGDAAGTVQISTGGVFAMRASGFSATQAIFDGTYSI